jgi:hypothetical protein
LVGFGGTVGEGGGLVGFGRAACPDDGEGGAVGFATATGDGEEVGRGGAGSATTATGELTFA